MLYKMTQILIFCSFFYLSNLSPGAQTLCIAHRGGAALGPENTMAAFENAVKIGVDYIELDVHLSKDGYVVVIHDDTLDRTTDCTGKVKDKTLAELKELDCGSWFSDDFKGERIPTLDEVMDFLIGKTGIVIEIKNCSDLDDGIEEKILELIREKNMVTEVMVISFSYDRIKKVHDLDGDISTGFLCGDNFLKALEMVRDVEADYISPWWEPVTEDIIEEAHSNNVKVGVWTVNEPDIMKKLLELGVDAITTDRPDLLLKELGR